MTTPAEHIALADKAFAILETASDDIKLAAGQQLIEKFT
jgi:hypothetical protein